MPNRLLMRAGFVLLLLAMTTGFLVPKVANPRMAVAAHVTAALAGLILVVTGLAWAQIARSPFLGRLLRNCLLFSGYGNWVAGVLASAWGTNKLTPLNGGPGAAAPWQETIVASLQVSQAIAIVVALSLAVYELRSRSDGESPRVGKAVS